MAISELLHVKQLFGGSREEPDDQTYRELLLMVLARATDVDAYTHPAEVDIVQQVLAKYIGEDVAESEIRIAAKSALYESAPLEKFVAKVGGKLPREQRLNLVSALEDVLRADDQVASSEAGYFNMICESLKVSHAEVVGLIAR